MYQGCIMRNIRTSCGSRTFPESSNSEGSERSALALRPVAGVPQAYPRARWISGPPAHHLLSQDSETKRQIREKR